MESYLSATLPDTVLAAAGIDVGFFATKFTCYRQSSPGKAGAIVADQFPSLAPRQAGMSIPLPNTDKPDAVEIEIEPNVSHLVGKDIDKLSHGFGSTAVTSDYSRGTAYKALFRGALHAIAPISEFDIVIVDSNIDPADLRRLRQSNVDVRIAQVSQVDADETSKRGLSD